MLTTQGNGLILHESGCTRLFICAAGRETPKRKKKEKKDTLSVGLYVCGGCAVRDVMSLLHPFLSHWSDMYFRFLMINGNELLTESPAYCN